MEFVPMLVMLAVAKKVVDLGRYASGREWNGVITQLVAWVAGVAVVVAFAQSDWASMITFGDFALSKMGFASQVIAGVTVGSAASLGQDALKAIDNQQTERKPTLL